MSWSADAVRMDADAGGAFLREQRPKRLSPDEEDWEELDEAFEEEDLWDEDEEIEEEEDWEYSEEDEEEE